MLTNILNLEKIRYFNENKKNMWLFTKKFINFTKLINFNSK